MDDAVSQGGTRGFSVSFPPGYRGRPRRTESPDDVHRIVFRSFDEGQEADVEIVASVPVSTVGYMGFKFCPWCGTRLAL
jgi:hypothetical protein